MTDQQWIEINQNIKTKTDDEVIKHKVENKIVLIIGWSILLILLLMAITNTSIPDLNIRNNKVQIGSTQGPN